MAEDRNDLTNLLAGILEEHPSKIVDSATQRDFKRWDSLRHLIIANSLEQFYGVRLSDRDIGEISSIKAIKEVLHKHLETAGPSVSAERRNVGFVRQRVHSGVSLEELRIALGHSVSFGEVHAAASIIRDASVQDRWKGPVVRVAVAGAITTEFITSAIACAIFQEGMLPVIYEAPYGSVIQETLNKSSGLYKFKPDFVLLAPDWRDEVMTDISIEGPDLITAKLADSVRKFTNIWDRLISQSQCKVLQHLFVPPFYNVRGLAERHLPNAVSVQVNRLNELLIEASQNKVAWIELDQLANSCGVGNFAGNRYYYNARMPFDPKFIPEYVSYFRAAWRTAAARAKKVLVLDLDNTLWGGVIGDDGVDGIKLGPGSPAGEAFYDWGLYIRKLASRGVILAICSKNDLNIAVEAFNHPHAVLKLEDFAAVAVSWDDKATNIRKLADALNVGLDTFVFVDDNPFECDLVREKIPEVGIVHLGDDPAQFAEIFDRGRWFDLPVYTKEDFSRSNAYRARAITEAARLDADDIDSYLNSLGMVGRLYEASAADLGRLVQMEQKTNQFNLTTRRFTEQDLRSFMVSDNSEVLAFELKDKHADHGVVSSIVYTTDDVVLTIDSWLMSCRVFSRTAEEFILEQLTIIANLKGICKIVGVFAPSKKNGVVADLYSRLGFSLQSASGDKWELDLRGAGVREPLKTFVMTSDPPTSSVEQEPSSEAKQASRLGPTVKETTERPPDLTLAAQTALAEKASAEADFEQALPAWRAVAALEPHNVYAQLRVLETLRVLCRYEEADDQARTQIKAFPNDPGIMFQYASNAVAASDWSTALARWSEALGHFPEFCEPRIGIAEALLRQDRIAEAEDAIAGNLYRFPTDIPSAKLYRSINGCMDADGAVLIKAAEESAAGEDLQVALRNWTRVVQRDNSNTLGYLRVIDTLVRLRRFEDAELYASHLVTRFPNNTVIHFQWSGLPAASGKWTLAFRRWALELANRGGWPEPRYGMAEASWKLGNVDEAKSLLISNIQLFPKHIQSGILLADILGERNEWASAAQVLHDLSERTPERPELGIRYAIALVHSEGAAAARVAIDAVLARHPGNPVGFEYRSWISSLIGDWATAFESAQAAIQADGSPESVSLARNARFHIGKTVGRSLVIYGNCQCDVLDRLLVRMRSLYEDLDVIRILGHLPEEAGRLSDKRIGECVVYWEQYDERTEVALRDQLRGLIPTSAKKLVYPSLSLFSLWPFNYPDSRSRPELPRFPHGRYPYDYGDVVGLQVAKEGLRGEAAFSRYMDLAATRLGNLQSQFDRDLAQMRKRDASSDVKMTEYILANYRKFPLFFTWGHVAGEVLAEVAIRLLSMSRDVVGGSDRDDAAQLRRLPSATSDFWMPIHPDVIRWHGLEYCRNDEFLYNLHGNWLTFREFMIKYIEYDERW